VCVSAEALLAKESREPKRTKEATKNEMHKTIFFIISLIPLTKFIHCSSYNFVIFLQVINSLVHEKLHPPFTLQPGIIITVWYVLLYQLNHHRDKVIIPMSHSGQNKVTKNL
jgi:hypothetical protein